MLVPDPATRARGAESLISVGWGARLPLSWDVTTCHDVIRSMRTVRTFRDAERTVTEGRGEKTNQVCEHYSARKLCFKCEKLWKTGRMLRVGASQTHNGPKKEAAGCKWTLQQLELKVTMSGSGRRLVGPKSRYMQNTAGVYLGLLWIPSFWLWHCNIDLTTELRTMTGPVNVIRRVSWWICLTSFPFYCQPFKIISIIHYSHQCK